MNGRCPREKGRCESLPAPFRLRRGTLCLTTLKTSLAVQKNGRSDGGTCKQEKAVPGSRTQAVYD